MKMLVYSTDFYGNQTFRMLPIAKNCPFNEVIYDPVTKVLAIVSKEFKEKPNMLPRLNEKGKPIIFEKAKLPDENHEYIQERQLMETYYEYYIDKVEDIKEFINMFAVNPNHESIKIIDEVMTSK